MFTRSAVRALCEGVVGVKNARRMGFTVAETTALHARGSLDQLVRRIESFGPQGRQTERSKEAAFPNSIKRLALAADPHAPDHPPLEPPDLEVRRAP